MARMEIAGIGIEYDLLGRENAPAVALTPGGRFSMESPGLRELGIALAQRGHRVLLWDRPNCGASDICFDGDGESRMQARALIGLITALNLGPTALAAGSAGSRVSLLAAAEGPDAISHLCLWWISGGISSLMMLGATYCCEQAILAAAKGMEAVAAMPGFADQIRRNPSNRDRIVNQDPDRFIATMERWAAGFIPSATSPVPGMSEQDFEKLAMPTLLVRASPTDLYHPVTTTEWVARLIPHAELIPSPWPDNVFDQRLDDAVAKGTGLFIDWPDLAPTIAEFIGRKH